jgi:hypothetical protein
MATNNRHAVQSSKREQCISPRKQKAGFKGMPQNQGIGYSFRPRIG